MLACLVAGCAAPRADRHAPPFARVPYEPFSRDAAIGIALHEWRGFGSRVDDTPPDPDAPSTSEDTPERAPGGWQRVGEYWWLSQDAGAPESAWTGKHDAQGRVFPPARDGQFAWSAAFVSYVMRSAGARDGFVYAPAHHAYVNAALERPDELRIRAERPEAYAPRAGDLICTGRDAWKGIRYDGLPADFAGHCDLVVDVAPGMLTVVGGNVGDSVTMKHVPVTDDGLLVAPDGTVVDTRYAWFVVVRVLYER